jgi:hypothetical protein
MGWMDYRSRCDRCGRFVDSAGRGVSWVMVPAIEVPGWDSGDERVRCARCTDKHGPCRPRPGVRAQLCSGVVT